MKFASLISCRFRDSDCLISSRYRGRVETILKWFPFSLCLMHSSGFHVMVSFPMILLHCSVTSVVEMF